jgi:hypothetical protein
VDEPELEGPRDHHYHFAHRVLPYLMFQDTLELFSLLTGGRAQEAMRELWERAGEHLAPDDRLPPDGLEVDGRSLGNGLLLVVTLPPPQRTGEARFVAAAVRWMEEEAPEPASGSASAGETGDPGRLMEVRVFTLEHHDPLEWASDAERRRLEEAGTGAAHTIFCEWTAEGAHVNLGRLLAPSVDAFAAVVAAGLGP